MREVFSGRCSFSTSSISSSLLRRSRSLRLIPITNQSNRVPARGGRPDEPTATELRRPNTPWVITLDVVGGGLDVAIGAVPPQASGVIVRKILSGRRVVCAAPGYLRDRGMPATPDDLKDHDCIRLVTGHQDVDRWSFRDGDGVRTIDIRGKLSTTSTEVVNAWVLAGHGIASRAEWDIAPELEAGRLVPCLEPYWSGPIALYASYASRRHLPPCIRAFMDFLTAALARPVPGPRP
ncbi:substrate binding domain-containing protein [Methylobacterium tarhaniae]|uniref:substrate binding domain-containing protein n=1 Tax=Methylobacterium tarhaniae TaxID=1187852 RepID=UPI003CFCB89A